MAQRLSSRERMLETIACREADYVPCCFMMFAALRGQCKDQFEFVERQLDLGLDATIGIPGWTTLFSRDTSEHADLRGLPVHFDAEVQVRNWREDSPGEEYSLLHREYITPAGTLHSTVTKTEDWVQGDRVPLFDDFVIPRARKRLVTCKEDLDALRYLLRPPSKKDVEEVRKIAAAVKSFADEHEVLIEGGWGSVVDTACWLCGIVDLILLAMDEPEFVDELLDLIADWNRQRMEVQLDAGVELFTRRGWYESSDLWSPALFERLVLPSLKKDAEIVHQADAKFGYIMTSGQTPVLDMLLNSGIDVLIGLDPVQGKGTDFQAMKHKASGTICLWGGVNGFVTIERGSASEVRDEVRNVLQTLAPGGGFVLSPVDNVTENTDRAWTNVNTLIEEWQRNREYPME